MLIISLVTFNFTFRLVFSLDLIQLLSCVSYAFLFLTISDTCR